MGMLLRLATVNLCSPGRFCNLPVSGQKMRSKTLLLIFMIALAGCKAQVDLTGRKVKIPEKALAAGTAHPTSEPDQKAYAPISKLPKEVEGTSPADATPIPAEATAIFPVDSLEGSVDPRAKDGYHLSDGNESEAGYVSLGRQAKGQIILRGVPLVSQPNYTSCGEAAFAIAWNYRHPDWALEIGTLETAGLKIGVYFPASLPGLHGYLGTSPAGMEAIGKYFADRHQVLPPTVGNINLDNGGAYARQEARGLLYSQLSAGNPVIIEVTDILGAPSKTYNDSHYVVITGMDFDAGRVTYNDPYLSLSTSGEYAGLERYAEWDAVWISWFTNRDINPGTNVPAGRGWYLVVH
jgi:hypothetical protein